MVARQKGLASLSRGIFTVALFVLLFSMASAYDCGGGAYPTASYWLRMEDVSGGAGLQFADACAGNNFTRIGQTYKTVSLWDYGHSFSQPVVDNWAIMDNASALTTGSRSWGLVFNMFWRTYNTGVFSDNDSAYGTDWANFMLWEADDGVYCYCRQGNNSLRVVYSPIPILTWQTVLCTYDTSDSNNLSIYMNGTLISSTLGDPCDFPITQGQSVIDSYPVVGLYPSTFGVYDEVYYFKGAVNTTSAYCLWAYNNLDCSEPTPPTPGNFSCSNTSLYTTQGILLSGFNDSDSCSLSVTRFDTSNIVETHTIANDCVVSGSRLSSDCYIYPRNSEVSYTVFLGEKYAPGMYNATVRCGSDVNNSFCFNIVSPALSVVDFNQFPQLLTTMKFTARSNSEKNMSCIAYILDNSTVVSNFPGVKAEVGKGVFTFEHYLLAENAYKNYTLNVTCDDYSTWQSEFKPVFANINIASATIFGISIELIFIGIAIILAGILVIGGYYLYKIVWGAAL